MLLLSLDLVAALGYLLAGVLLLLRMTGTLAMAAPRRPGLALATMALAVHGAALLLALMAPVGTVALGLGNVLSLFGWMVVLLWLLGAWRWPLDNLGIVLLPVSALAVLAPNLLPHGPFTRISSPGLQLHVAASVVGYGLLTLAAAQALLLAWQERALRRNRVMPALPPMETMEGFLFQLMAVGFALLLLVLGTGIAYVDDLFAQQLAHKTVFSMLAAGVFGILLIGRWRAGWRGRTAIRYTLGGYVLLALAYFGSKFVLEILLGRA